MNKEKRFDRIVRDIKSVKIQGARNIAKAALYAYSLNPTEKSREKLVRARLTEPMLANVLNKFKKLGYRKTLAHFQDAQEKINLLVSKIIRNNSIIFVHCHSTNVVSALIYSKKKGKKFQVYNTETRPLMQGRITSRELKRAGIRVTQFVDSAISEILEGKQGIKKPSMIFLGADAILNSGAINKIGSGAIAELAKIHNVPLYIIADSWKYSPHQIKMEERDSREVWNSRIKIRNLSFEKIDKKYIKSVVSEFGILSYGRFLKKAGKN